MAVGRREEWRLMLLAEGAIIQKRIDELFGGDPFSEQQIEMFLRKGVLGGRAEKEPPNPEVDRIVAQILRDGGRLTRIEGH